MKLIQREMPAAKTIALVAHDKQKDHLLSWADQHRNTLALHKLCATGTTGHLVARLLDQKVESLLSGPMGGDQQLGARIAESKVDLLVFFWDPLEQQPHDPDVKALLRIAAVWNIPVACNKASADFLITSDLLRKPYQQNIPDYQAYLDQRVN